jgi:hypothetical protein
MDAPEGRYRVIEKDGRLIVIDNMTGAPASPPPPRPGGPARPGAAAPAPVVAAGRGAIDGAGDFLLALVTREWDGEGRAVIAWEWKEGGRPRRWDARLDAGQQRRLGRALLGVALVPLPVLAFIFGSGALIWIAAAIALPPAFWGIAAIRRLQRETADQMPI